ncbi:thioesterase superfamily protein [Arthrobacter sp. Hiyo8]|nr:thioesterase superfamily protein [Arthrobacter sp. Hiyo8]
MKWIDEAAYVCASRYCGKDTVAVFSGACASTGHC